MLSRVSSATLLLLFVFVPASVDGLTLGWEIRQSVAVGVPFGELGDLLHPGPVYRLTPSATLSLAAGELAVGPTLGLVTTGLQDEATNQFTVVVFPVLASAQYRLPIGAGLVFLGEAAAGGALSWIPSVDDGEEREIATLKPAGAVTAGLGYRLGSDLRVTLEVGGLFVMYDEKPLFALTGGFGVDAILRASSP